MSSWDGWLGWSQAEGSDEVGEEGVESEWHVGWEGGEVGEGSGVGGGSGVWWVRGGERVWEGWGGVGGVGEGGWGRVGGRVRGVGGVG